MASARSTAAISPGAEREFSTGTLEMIGEMGHVTGVKFARVDQTRTPLPGTEFVLSAELVLIAIGFASPVHEGLVTELDLVLDGRGNVLANTQDYRTSNPKVFAAGDMRMGQSLVVWAIREGRQAAHAIDKFLMGSTELPR